TITSGPALLALIGLLITGVLLGLRVKGALFIAILLTTLIGIPMQITSVPSNFFTLPAMPYFFDFEWSQIFTWDMLIVVLTFLFVDIFDTVGTLVGVSTKAGMLTADGKVPHAKRALLSDAIATAVGAILGTSTVTTYVESAAGVAEGGRTGLTSLFTAIFFGLSLLLSPLFIMIPSAATAPALILVGLFMASPIKEINFDDFTESIPAFITFLMMPLTYSISEGIMFGIISYVLMKLFTLRIKDLSPVTVILSILFVLKFIYG
ncbi:MAG: NCS2 family permease, partial [Bacillota bacterium]|nr:NCS2 family permease [Bacillota bacterium]